MQVQRILIEPIPAGEAGDLIEWLRINGFRFRVIQLENIPGEQNPPASKKRLCEGRPREYCEMRGEVCGVVGFPVENTGMARQGSFRAKKGTTPGPWSQGHVRPPSNPI